MESSEKIIERRTDRIIRWLKNPYNFLLVAILIFAFVIRLYHFTQTWNQPIWWDEAEYMASAKYFAFDIPYDPNIQRPILFQFIASFFLRAGLGEMSIKFILVLLPSVLLVWAVYFLGKEMFNKKVGLIAALLISASWTLLFWTARIQPDYLSMSFQILAIALMWKYWKNPKAKLIIFSGIFAGLGVHFKISGFLIPIIFVLFIFCKDRFSALKNKHYYYFAIAFLLTLTPYFIWSYVLFDTPLGFTHNYSPTTNLQLDFPWKENLIFFHTLAGNVLLVLFLFGAILAFKFLFYIDVLIKNKRKCFDPEIFSILVIIVISLFYIFWIRETQDRWVFLWLPFIFFFVGNSLMFIYNQIKKHQKIIAIILVGGLLLFAVYSQVNQANGLIEARKTSYLPVKEAGIWIKENSQKTDVVFSNSEHQNAYYSERETIHFYKDKSGNWQESNFNDFIDLYKPRFISISIFEKNPPWIGDWIDKNQNRLTPVQAYFADAEQSQPLLVVYEVGY